MAGNDLIELQFRLSDGTDIGPAKFDISTKVETIKENILARWPDGTQNAPKTVNDIKLINGGRFLENNETLADSRLLVGELAGSVITMHVVVKPLSVDKNNENQRSKAQQSNRCACTIL